jgi:hypothetical protein
LAGAFAAVAFLALPIGFLVAATDFLVAGMAFLVAVLIVLATAALALAVGSPRLPRLALAALPGVPALAALGAAFPAGALVVVFGLDLGAAFLVVVFFTPAIFSSRTGGERPPAIVKRI